VRSVIITGVSRGLGAALFAEFHAAGDRILALGRRFSADQQAAALAEPDRVRLRRTELADPATLPGAAELAEFVRGGGAAEALLVLSAAVFEPFGPIGALSAAGAAATVAVNLTATILLTNALLAGRPIPPADAADAAQGTAPVTVLLVSSSAAHRLSGGRSLYAATKRGAETFLSNLEHERAADPGVRVVIVDPGIMDTGMQAVVRRHAREDAYFPDRERFIERYERGDLPSPVDVARKIIAEQLG
jgi:NAD(P)-dependent dehydrogenase (short-subunit alcohol dehydrogenase family)